MPARIQTQIMSQTSRSTPPQNVPFLQLENETLRRNLQRAKEDSGLALQAVVRKANHEIQCLKDDLKRANADREQLEAS